MNLTLASDVIDRPASAAHVADPVRPSPMGHARLFRADIQVLRGIAVLAVVLYHAKLGLFSSGFLGVDVFFVISGFLITGLIRNGLDRKDFKLGTFYFRRAKRLLPAAYIVFFAVVLAAPFVLTSTQLEDLTAQIIGAITFCANFVLWHQTGYFNSAAELKPLLHTWSLSAEEQYYFFLPGMMLLLPRHFWLPAIICVLTISLGARIGLAGHPAMAFYLLPTRVWELMIGSAGALLAAGPFLRPVLHVLLWPALGAIFLVLASDVANTNSLGATLVICAATLVVILRNHPTLFLVPPVRWLSSVGDISYSLYLVHWPLFAFYANMWVTGVESNAMVFRLGLVALSLALSYLLNRFIERPAHFARITHPRRFIAVLLSASIAIAALAEAAWLYRQRHDETNFANRLRPNWGLGKQCAFDGDYQPLRACQTSERPKYLVWGDSYGMHVIPGLLADRTPPVELAQATRFVCAPFIGVSLLKDAPYDRDWAESCLRFNDSVLQYLASTPSITTVILASPFDIARNGGEFVRDGNWRARRNAASLDAVLYGMALVRDENGKKRVIYSGVDTALDGMKKTVEAVRALGKMIVVLEPPPRGSFDVGLCLQRIHSGLLTVGGCKISESNDHAARADILKFLSKLSSRADVNVVDGIDRLLCINGQCRTEIDGVYIYRDSGHFSVEGSRYMAKHLRLLDRIDALAR